jgi:hypothetical protein
VLISGGGVVEKKDSRGPPSTWIISNVQYYGSATNLCFQQKINKILSIVNAKEGDKSQASWRPNDDSHGAIFPIVFIFQLGDLCLYSCLRCLLAI